MRSSILIILQAIVFFSAHAAAHAQRVESLVSFDSPLSVSCRDVTPKNASTKDAAYRLIEARLKLTSKLNIPESELDCIEYRISLPQSCELQDYLPKTAVNSVFASPIETKNSHSSKSRMQIVYGGGGSASFSIPGVANLSGGGEGKSVTSNADSTASGIQVDLLPPKQLVLGAGTEERGRVLYFRMRPFNQITLEGQREFGCLLKVPKDWKGECIELSCLAYIHPRKHLAIRKKLGLGLYLSNNESKKLELEKIAKKIDSIEIFEIPKKQLLVKETESKKREVTNVIPAGKYRITMMLVNYELDLKSDGTFTSTAESGLLSGKMKTLGEGSWSVINNKLSLFLKRSKMTHSMTGLGSGWVDDGGESVLLGGKSILSSNNERFLLEDGFILTRVK